MEDKEIRKIVREVIRDEFAQIPTFHGPKNRFLAHPNSGLCNTLFNTNSGKITIG